MPWYKGNLHCHSTNSDGAVSPLEVAAYYSSIGMDFVTVSDHNRLTPPSEYAAALSSDQAAIPCCEYTGPRSCHVVGVDVDQAVAPSEKVLGARSSDGQSSASPVEILGEGVRQIRSAGGVPVLCHPCWNWAYGAREILSVEEASHFELFNAAPDCNSYPVAGRSATEAIWDEVLSTGRQLYGVATDDAHWYDNGSTIGRPPTISSLSGKGWCVVWAKECSSQSVRGAFQEGRFYASTGIELTNYRVTTKKIEVAVTTPSEQQVHIEFIGSQGRSLSVVRSDAAEYRFDGTERYVRVRIEDSSGCYAFTQPVFLDAMDDVCRWTGEA